MNKPGRPVSLSPKERKQHLVVTVEQRIIDCIKIQSETTGKSVSSIVNTILRDRLIEEV